MPLKQKDLFSNIFNQLIKKYSKSCVNLINILKTIDSHFNSSIISSWRRI